MAFSKKRILLSFGTRPEAIKMAPLIHALRENSDSFETIVCVTAQHRQMLDQALNIFDIKPDIDLNLMKQRQDLYDITAEVLLAMRSVLNQVSPDILLVHGDTTTTLASAIAGFYAGISIGHIEAGLRTWNMKEPFPEEFNRQTVAKLAKWNFAPTQRARQNLLAEGIDPKSIFMSGNTVIDSLFWVMRELDANQNRKNKVIDYINDAIGFDWQSCRFILITGHRRENHGANFIQICEAIRELARSFCDVNFVYPVHPNPAVNEPAYRMLGGIKNIHLIQPLDYEPFLLLLRACYLVLTDSGGIQEEAPSFKKPVLVMRDSTERPEGVEAGVVGLVGASKVQIIENVSRLLLDNKFYQSMIKSDNPYGDGMASQKIISILKNG